MSTLVAVDVGGSGLRLLVCRDGVVSAPRRADGARVGAGGLDVPALAADARMLLEAEGVRDVDAVCWSSRGLLFLAEPAEVLAAVGAAVGARRTAVVSDAVANLVGALGEVVPGAVVAAGTGAVAFGSDFAAHWTRVDGWGHVLGDRGSAAGVGLEGLRAALRAADGVGGGSDGLLEAAERLLGPRRTWPRRVMTAADAPEALASVAPLVTAAAGAGDDVAAGICAAAGRSLGESLLAAAHGLERPRLALTGGLLAADAVRRPLVELVREAGHEVAGSVGGALDGALLLARRLEETGDLPRHDEYVHVAHSPA
ncbi:BadF/BadG/BcrA/BcrD ATPase family protein [Phycicoccus avicenniae]|uniref:BadF/BadG/BcrA/BcrD ATPase family protein n=1 Tax=Phycicoccus avicenniae TaxID=2828860 RepID=UPI003D270216